MMENVLKGLFSSKSGVGLEVATGAIGTVQVLKTWKGLEIGHYELKTYNDIGSIDTELKALFDRQNLRGHPLISCVPGTSAFIRQILLPLKKPGKVEKVIQYQLEPHVPYAVDEMVVDFFMTGSEETVTAVGVLKKVLADHLEVLARADLSPEQVGVDDLALSVLYLQTRGVQGPPAAIVRHTERHLGFQVFREGRLEFIRMAPVGDDPEAVILESSRLYQLKAEDARLDEILLVGDVLSRGDLGERIGAQLGVRSSYWRPFDHFQGKAATVETEMQNRLAVPLGLALTALGPPCRAVNLRKQEFSTGSSRSARRGLLGAAVAAFILTALVTFNVFWQVHRLESRNEALKKEVTALFREAFPGTQRIVPGQELAQMEQRMKEETGRVQWLREVMDAKPVLEILSVLTKTISAFGDVKVENASVDGHEIRLDGQAASFETVDRLKEALTNAGAFDSVRLSGAKMDKKANAVKFNFGLVWKP